MGAYDCGNWEVAGRTSRRIPGLLVVRRGCLGRCRPYVWGGFRLRCTLAGSLMRNRIIGFSVKLYKRADGGVLTAAGDVHRCPAWGSDVHLGVNHVVSFVCCGRFAPSGYRSCWPPRLDAARFKVPPRSLLRRVKISNECITPYPTADSFHVELRHDHRRTGATSRTDRAEQTGPGELQRLAIHRRAFAASERGRPSSTIATASARRATLGSPARAAAFGRSAAVTSVRDTTIAVIPQP